MSLQNGTIIADRYRLIRLIATGGMGQVWEAIDTRLNRRVAVKVLKAEYSDDPEFTARFRTEAQTTAKLNNPGIANVFDYGETPDYNGGDPLAYLVMELVDGEPLNSVLKRTGRLSLRHALDMLEQTGRALNAAHAMNNNKPLPGERLLEREDEDVASGEITRVSPIALYSHRVPARDGTDPGAAGERPEDPAVAALDEFARQLQAELGDAARVTARGRAGAPAGGLPRGPRGNPHPRRPARAHRGLRGRAGARAAHRGPRPPRPDDRARGRGDRRRHDAGPRGRLGGPRPRAGSLAVRDHLELGRG